jgi:hypothetical protein
MIGRSRQPANASRDLVMIDRTSAGDIVMNSFITSSVYGFTERMILLSIFLPLIVLVVFMFFTPFAGDAFLAARFVDAFFFDAFFVVFFFMDAPVVNILVSYHELHEYNRMTRMECVR